MPLFSTKDEVIPFGSHVEILTPAAASVITIPRHNGASVGVSVPAGAMTFKVPKALEIPGYSFTILNVGIAVLGSAVTVTTSDATPIQIAQLQAGFTPGSFLEMYYNGAQWQVKKTNANSTLIGLNLSPTQFYPY